MTQPGGSGGPVEDAGPQPEAGKAAGGWLTRNLAVLSGVSFLQDAASELLYPIMPIFLTAVLGAPAAVVGAVEGVAEGAASVTKLGAGLIGDRFARKPLIAGGYGLAAFGKLLIALAGSWPAVLAGRVVDRLGKGVRGAPRDALLVAGIPAAARGRAFGLHRTADTLGAVVGPLLGLAAYELLQHRIRPLLVVAVVPAVLSVLLVAAVREDHRPPVPSAVPVPVPAPGAENVAAQEVLAVGEAADGVRNGDGPGLRGLRGLPPVYWRVVVVLAGFSLVNFPDALLLLRLNEIGFSVTSVILAYVTYNAVYALASYPAGALSDRLPRHRVFGIGLLFFGIGYLGLGLVHDQWLAWILLAVYGLFAAFTDGVGKGWVSSLVDGGRQARAQGVFQGATGAGVLLAGIWAGLAWHGDGRLPLLLSGVAGLGVAAALLTTRARHWAR
ncbi:MAG TPA: MFS transporter [Kineosporiaceae bacterium]|nr:MFS transporter [Kineosporiaceae bacterium]